MPWIILSVDHLKVGLACEISIRWQKQMTFKLFKMLKSHTQVKLSNIRSKQRAVDHNRPKLVDFTLPIIWRHS